MSELRDPAIKLFGRNIPVPDSVPDANNQPAMDESTQATNTEVRDTPSEKSCKDFPSNSDEGRENNFSNSTLEIEAERNHNSAEEQGAPNNLSDQEKVLKKPDKILPCPRCNSLDTKFCYFNNYNVNQPRHFCKNCHRYWTAGGTMRNVPVGAGRRKNKHLSSQYRQVVVSPVAESDTLSSANHQHLSCVGLSAASRPAQQTGEALKFSRDAPLCESMAASLNLRDSTLSVKIGSATVGNSGEEPSSSGCSSASTTVRENELPEIQMEQVNFPGQHDSFTPEQPMQCYPGPTWAYPWNPGWNPMMFASNNNNHNNGNTGSPPVMAISSFCPPSITVPLVPASYWGCMPSWDGRNWSIPLVATSDCLSPSSSASNGCSGNNSPTLGKHSKDASLQAEEKSEQSLWIPKTLRIDDPDEAAKSSIWDTLGIKPNDIQPIKKGGIFKAFQSKPETVSRTSDADADHVLQANPAAFSRFQTFRENT